MYVGHIVASKITLLSWPSLQIRPIYLPAARSTAYKKTLEEFKLNNQRASKLFKNPFSRLDTIHTYLSIFTRNFINEPCNLRSLANDMPKV